MFVRAFVDALANALTIAVFARAVLSWVDVTLPFGLGQFVQEVSEPVLGPIRRLMPASAGLDLSPFIALLLIQLAHSVVLGLLSPAF